MFCIGNKNKFKKSIAMASVSEVDQVAVPSTRQLKFSHLSEHKYKKILHMLSSKHYIVS